ncbi:MAG: hypothetical protein GXP42_16710, partial [Chloroflexi bacterium]|nr:hypothetical protein [Chloroflexota bacterium]
MSDSSLASSARRRVAPAKALLLALILLGLLLRLIRLDFQPLWWDEGYSVWFAGQALPDMVRLTAEDIHPPFYYALLHGWSLALGLQPAALRLFSVLVSLAAIPLAYLLGRDLSGEDAVGLLAAALAAVNPFAIFYGQEIRMYGLAATLSLAALWTGWRWASPNSRPRFGLAYALTTLAGLYTLYYFALLPLAQTIWVAAAARSRLRQWLAALLAVLFFYAPWLVYAGPKLLDYVAYKVVQDNDAPLPLLPYLGRHLSAFLVGHLEGWMASLWAWPLLLLIPLAAALILASRSSTFAAHESQVSRGALLYLILCLAVPLGVGFIQQLQAPFIPERFERVLLFAAPAFWLLVALGLDALRRDSRLAAGIVAGFILFFSAASLYVFYTTPRYQGRDYRPLIETVRRQAQPGDSVFTIFPWQTGYFWAYLPPEQRPAIVPSPRAAWDPTVQQTLDDLLEQGAVWFPEHLALGAIFETDVETYLDQNSHQLLNRWFGDETRLTAWVAPPVGRESVALETPILWENRVALIKASMTPAAPAPSDQRLFLDLTWRNEQPLNPADLTYSIWLGGPDGFRWAQRDVNPFAHPEPSLPPGQAGQPNRDRIALNLPVGLPPGEYDIWIALLDAEKNPIAVTQPEPDVEAWLGAVVIPSGFGKDGWVGPMHPAAVSGVPLDFLGYERPGGPYLPGDDVIVSLYWRPNGALQEELYGFVQLLDDRGQVVAGVEGPPVSWHPTTQWPIQVPVRSQMRLRIPADLSAGRYRMIAGL